MTVAVMMDAALRSQDHLPVRLLAEEVCSKIGSKDYLSEILACYYFVLANTRYMRDPRTVELVRAPHVVVKELTEGRVPNLDCDDMTAFLIAMLLAVGCECRIVTVAFRNAYFKGTRQYSHVFAQAKEPRTHTWITLDPVAAEKTAQMLRRVKAAKIWPVA
jgi:transglutaminase-like putative cysteine protease